MFEFPHTTKLAAAASVELSPLLAAGDVARLVCRRPATVLRWARLGVLPAYRLAGGVRFTLEDVEAFIASGYRQAAA
jgi:hypothetical protein